jgi:single-stranded-DNA-specific exonuclease
MAPVEREWRIADSDPAAARVLAGVLGLSRAAAALLCGRGLQEPDAVRRFLEPRLSDLGDPFLLPAMRPAVDRIRRALAGAESIVVFGDYDVDGLTSTALLTRVLRALGGRVEPFLPLRLEEGYGLGVDALHRCLEQFRPGLIITVDCGTGAAEAVREAAARGVDIVVTDHHEPGPEVAPAVAVVNPKLGPPSSLHQLAGVGVAFKLSHALLKELRSAGGAGAGDLDLRRHLDLVALGTIADIVPLREENRILARHGLQVLGGTDKVGLRALAEVAGLRGPVDAYDVGFRLGPRLNAAGRLGDALNALELLLSVDPARCADLAQLLDAANRDRQQIESDILAEALASVEGAFDPDRDFGLVVAGAGWHPGVIGIVASRLVQRYGRPAICLALGAEGARGSCRSIEGFDMAAELQACHDLLRKHGGHAMAAGLEMEAQHVDAFRTRFNAAARTFAGGRRLLPVQKVDAWVDLEEADDRLLEELDRLRPFGCAHATPVWAARNLRVVGKPQTVGKGHVKFRVAGGALIRDCIAFGRGDAPLPAGPLDIAFQLRRDTFQGRSQLMLNVQDVRAAAS